MASQPDESQRMMVALGYLFTPLVPLVILLSDMKTSTFMRRHAIQALLWSIVFVAVLVAVVVLLIYAIRADILFICLLPFALLLPFVPGAIWARAVYLGGDVTIPVFGRFVDSR